MIFLYGQYIGGNVVYSSSWFYLSGTTTATATTTTATTATATTATVTATATTTTATTILRPPGLCLGLPG